MTAQVKLNKYTYVYKFLKLDFDRRYAMPGYKLRLQNNEELREGVKCSYCRLILRDPVQTAETGQRYCRECVKEAVKFAICVIHIHSRAHGLQKMHGARLIC